MIVDSGDPVLPWGERLRRWRADDRCWSQQELVDRMVRLAFEAKEDRGTRLDVRLVGKWECGHVRRPQAVYRRLLARLGAPVPVETDPRPGQVRSPPERSRSGRIDPAAVAALAAQVEGTAGRYEAEMSASLLVEAAQQHAALRQLLGGSGSERVLRQLHQAIAVSAELLGQLVWDASGRRDGVAATGYCNVAIDHAMHCGDHVTAANGELRKAYVSLYGSGDQRNPREGLDRAQAAARQAAAAAMLCTVWHSCTSARRWRCSASTACASRR